MTNLRLRSCVPAGISQRGRTGPVLGLLVTAALTTTLAACGSDDAGGDSSASAAGEGAEASEEQLILGFYQCLRDNGLDVADPDLEGSGPQAGGGPPGIDTNDPAAMEVVELCRDAVLGDVEGPMQFGDGAGGNMADTSSLIEFVSCIRDQGIDMPDPSSDGRLAMPDNVDPQSNEFQAAVQECSEHLDGGGIRMGEPGGGGVAGRGN
ncbi:hypothetical protein [Phytoactinopolyspora mesophila]|uniref:Uncharacterized protein n=1 Tax=Phytoactinopolyspora mesophila TaxID=2650750 RepID=A0A7K3M5J4_9ACTN|nr:hypothetical protein [Phytoactinopolyspora mesophila]NDL58297.1 hypothetical protein [Phytoactinopolyspora mesophila]